LLTEDRQVHVAAQDVEHVVTADREPVTVARDHEDLQLGPRTRSPVAIAGARPWIVWKPYVFM